jgi:DNA-binding NtrC family response regulator
MAMADEPQRCGTVLIAVEEPMVARILEHKLRREGHSVRCVREAALLQAALRDEAPDVLLVSVPLLEPGMLQDESMRPRAGWLLLVNSFDKPDAAHQAMHAGAAGIVRMPFKPTVVAAQVATLLSLVAA